MWRQMSHGPHSTIPVSTEEVLPHLSPASRCKCINMSTRRVKCEAVVKLQLLERIPVHLVEEVRRSSRTTLLPKRCQDSSAAETPKKKGRTKMHNDKQTHNKTQDLKEEEAESGDEEHTPERIPVNLVEEVRRSSRTTLVPKRFQYSPAAETPKKKRRTQMHSDKHIENKTQEEDAEIKREEADLKEEEAESSDVEHTSSGHGGLSAYELERLENIRQNQAFLSSINLFKASEELKELTQPKPSQRGLMRSHPAAKQMLPARKSLRLQNKEAEILTLPPEPTSTSFHEQSAKKAVGPLPMDPINMEEGSKLPSQLLELCSEVSEEKKVALDLDGYRSGLKNMRITEGRVAKVVKDRIFSATFHPCASSLLMAAGDKWGKVGLWKLEGGWGDDGVLLFEPHTRPVGCMAFSWAHAAHLLSSSYDGSLRCMDVEKAVFDDVYDIEDGLKTFDFMSHDCLTLVVGTWYGEVAIVDRRTPGNSHESLHLLDPKTLRCVSVHPLQKQYFAVAESKVVSIYDSRYLKKKNCQAVSQLQGHSLSICSAYFSPCTGNRVLTSCMDNNIRIYDTSAMTAQSPLLTKIRHDMQTGRWLSKLSAVWDPKQEECFVVGSMLRPRRVQVFHESGQLQHSFMDDENLNTVLSVTAFHPTRNALLGGNSSGRLHVFSD